MTTAEVIKRPATRLEAIAMLVQAKTRLNEVKEGNPGRSNPEAVQKAQGVVYVCKSEVAAFDMHYDLVAGTCNGHC